MPVRDRLIARLEAVRGEATVKTVQWLAEEAGVSYTTLARFIFRSYSKRTRQLRRATIDRVARALKANTAWLATGQGVEQRSFWPARVREEEPHGASDPAPQVAKLVDSLRELPEPMRNRAYRVVVASVIETLAASGQPMPPEAYECLILLDALLSTTPRKRAG